MDELALQPILSNLAEAHGELARLFARIQFVVFGDINSRRGRIDGMEDVAGTKRITAYCPMAEMFGYATSLRSMTQGRGTFILEPSHYEEVPKNVMDAVLKDRGGY